jgi:integrase/recombinase XerD
MTNDTPLTDRPELADEEGLIRPVVWREFNPWMFDAKGLAPSTRELYVRRTRACERWLFERGEHLLDADTRQLTGWVYQLPPTPSSRNMGRQAVHAFFAFLVAGGHREDNPVDPIPTHRHRQTTPTVLSGPEAAAVLAAAEDRGPMWPSALSVMLHSGLRATEARTLTWAAVNPDGWVSFRAKGGKDRVLPLHPHTLDALMRWQQLTDDPHHVFPSPTKVGSPLSETNWRRNIKAIGEAAGIEGLHPHVARHTCAVTMLDAGVNVRVIQEVLGHASLATTQKYLTVRPSQLAEAIGSIRYGDGG